MTLKHKIVPVDLFTGVDTGTDPQMSGGKLVKAENAVYKRNKAISKRNGFNQLPGTHLGEYLGRFNDQVIMHGSNDSIGSMDPSVLFYVCGRDGKAFKFEPLNDDEEQWTELATGTAYHLYDCHGVAKDDMWFVGGNGFGSGILLHYDGVNFTSYALPAAVEVTGVWAVATDNVFATALTGRLWNFDGNSWSEVYWNGTFGIGPEMWHDGTLLYCDRKGLSFPFIGTWNGAAWTWDTSEGMIADGLCAKDSGNIYVCDQGLVPADGTYVFKGSIGSFVEDDSAIQDNQASSSRCLWVDPDSGEVFYTFYRYGGGGVNGIRYRNISGSWSTLFESSNGIEYGTIRGASKKILAVSNNGWYAYGSADGLTEFRHADGDSFDMQSCMGFESLNTAKSVDSTSPYSDEMAYMYGEVIETRYKAGAPYNVIDAAENGSHRVLGSLFEFAGNVWGEIATYNVDTGALIDLVEFSDAGLNSYGETSIRCIATDTRIFVFFVKSTDSETSWQIYYRSINVETGGIGDETLFPGSIANVESSILELDACYLGGSEEWVGFVYCSDQGGNPKPYIVFFNGAVENIAKDVSGVGTVCTTLACYSMGTDPEELNLIYADETGGNTLIKAKGFYTDHSQAAAEATMGTISGTSKDVSRLVGILTGTDTSRVYWNYKPSASVDFGWRWEIDFNEYSGGAATHGSYKTLDARGLIQVKPFTGSDADIVYLTILPLGIDKAGYYSSIDLKYAILKHVGNTATEAFLAGKFLDGRAGLGMQVAGLQTIDPIHQFAMVRFYGETTGACIAQVRLDVGNVTGFGKTCQSRYHMILPGLMPRIYDGQQCVEQGFLVFPYGVKVAYSGNPASNLEADKTYGYVAVYRWFDSQGNLHRSAPSPVSSWVQKAAASEETFDVYIPPLCITEKTDIEVDLYRTKGDGSIYYLLMSLTNTSGAYVTYEDDTADSDIDGQEYLYTDSGEIENVQAQTYIVHCIHQDRHIISPLEKTDVLQYSKDFGDYLGLEHCGDNLQFYVPPDGGRPTALASHQNQLIIFKEKRSYYTYGDGLDVVGSGTEYKMPALLSAGIGCPNQRTLVQCPLGLAFQAQNGNFYLIDTKFQANPIGDPVDWYTNNYTVSEGVLLEHEDCVIWLTSDGPALVWNYHFNMWSTWVISGTACVVDADEQLVFKSAAGDIVMQQDRTSYVDGEDNVNLLLELAWIGAIGQSMHIRKRILSGYKKGDFSLGIKQAYNGDPYWKDTKAASIGSDIKTFGIDDIMGDGLASTYEYDSFTLEFDGSRHKCGLIRFQIYDDGSTNEAFEITGLALEMALRPTRHKVGSTRRL